MKILALLQNQWFRDPERVRSLLARRDEAFRRRFIARALFAGCLTGQRLKAAFGEELCSAIIWEEVSREITGSPSAKVHVDLAHVQAVLEAERPHLVLAFGQFAHAAISKCVKWAPAILAPHPAARNGGTPAELARAAEKLRDFLARREAF